MAQTSLDFFVFAILDFFLRPVFNFPGKVPIVARVAFETFLCTSASMGGRGGWRIIDGQNKSRLFLFAILDFFSDTRFLCPWKIVNPCRLGLRLTG